MLIQKKIKVVWALSLPGKVAPVSAGRIIKDTNSTLEFVMNGIDKRDFSLYIQLCSEKGFTYDIVNADSLVIVKNAVAKIEEVYA